MREWGFTAADLYKFKAERLRTDPPNAGHHQPAKSWNRSVSMGGKNPAVAGQVHGRVRPPLHQI